MNEYQYLLRFQHRYDQSNTICMPTNEQLTYKNIIIELTWQHHIPNIYPTFVQHDPIEVNEQL